MKMKGRTPDEPDRGGDPESGALPEYRSDQEQHWFRCPLSDSQAHGRSALWHSAISPRHAERRAAADQLCLKR